MILVNTDCIQLMSVLKVLVVVERELELTEVVVATCPLTIDVNVLDAEKKVFVVEATAASILVVATLPLTVEVSSPVVVA